jgi:hypothetical protein
MYKFMCHAGSKRTRGGGQDSDGRRSRRAARTRRRCLSCAQAFDSAGAEERICTVCKAGEDWADAVAACHGHIAW